MTLLEIEFLILRRKFQSLKLHSGEYLQLRYKMQISKMM